VIADEPHRTGQENAAARRVAARRSVRSPRPCPRYGRTPRRTSGRSRPDS
jgi:hypothetical protein